MKSQVKKFHGDSVKKESAGAKKLEGAPNAPTPRLYRVKLFKFKIFCF